MFSREEVFDKTIFNEKYGLVLAGGGGKGAYQAGVFKALNECNLSACVESAAGTSVGGLNMCLFVQKDKGLAEKVWKGIKQNQFTKVDVEYLDFKEGLFGREGLEKIMENSIDFQDISASTIDLFATVAEYDEYGMGEPTARYIKLNEKSKEEIKKILLATSAIPGVYEPVKLGEHLYRDGGVVDNLPIKPLYDMGVRNFIVITLSMEKKINMLKYPGAKFIHIKPSQNLGDAITGTMDFSGSGANVRFKLGYADAMRTLKYYNSPESKLMGFEEMIQKQADIEYNSILMEQKVDDTGKMISKDMKKIDKLMNKYSIDL